MPNHHLIIEEFIKDNKSGIISVIPTKIMTNIRQKTAVFITDEE